MSRTSPAPHIRLGGSIVLALLVALAAGLLGSCGGSGGGGGPLRAPLTFSAGPTTPIPVLSVLQPPHLLVETELSDNDEDGNLDLSWVFATTFVADPAYESESMPGAGDGTFAGSHGGVVFLALVPPLLTTGNVLGVGAEGYVKAVQNGVGLHVLTFGQRTLVGGGTVMVGGTQTFTGALAGLAVGDWNGDQVDDVAVVDAAGLRVVACLSLGETGLDPGQPTPLPAGVTPSGLAAGHFDDDADMDLVVGLGADGYVVLGSAGSGLFLPQPVVALGAGRYFTEMVVGDFDGDGLADVAGVVAQPGEPNRLGVLLGQGNSAFGGLLLTTLDADLGATALRHLHVGDLDGDGRDDLAFVVPSLDRAVVALSDGAGGFVVAADPDFVGLAADTLSLGDVDRDGDLDLLIGSAVAMSVRVFFNDLR